MAEGRGSRQVHPAEGSPPDAASLLSMMAVRSPVSSGTLGEEGDIFAYQVKADRPFRTGAGLGVESGLKVMG